MLIGCKKILDKKFSPAGYNIVINVGEAADQNVMHCHVHIIPRYTCPADNPPGGIKGIIFREPEGGSSRENVHHTFENPE